MRTVSERDEIRGLLRLETLALAHINSYPDREFSRMRHERMLNIFETSAHPRLQGPRLGGIMWRADDQGHWAPLDWLA